jgi:hypothetical protein
VTIPYGRILGCLDRYRYFFFQAVLQLYSRGRVHPVPGPYFSENMVVPGIEPRTSGYVARYSDH